VLTVCFFNLNNKTSQIVGIDLILDLYTPVYNS